MSTQTKKQPVALPTIGVPFSKLFQDPVNVRTLRSANGIKALADNIEAEGLLQGLIVRKAKGGKYAVVAGERRRRALALLVKRKVIAASQEIPCHQVNDNLSSASLAENIHREGMHPADQFEAWRKMAEEGLSVEEIAKRHGATKCLIEKRLKLGRLSPVILEALRNDKLDIERAQAFTVSEDHARQEAVFKSLSQGGHYLNSRSIKAALTEGEVPSTDKLAVFVGRRAYRAAGGEIRSDLFGKVVYFKDRDLLIKLAGDALARAAEKLRAKGWLWIEASFDNDAPHSSGLRRVEPKRIAFSKEDKAEKTGLETRLRELEEADDGNVEAYDEWKEIEERLRELEGKRRAFRPTDMAKAGGYLFIGRDGELESALGYVRPGDDPRAEAAAAKKKAAEKAEAQPKGFSKSLRDDLAALRLEMMRAELIAHPAVACDLMAFHLIRSVMEGGHTASPLSLSAHQSHAVCTKSSAGDMGAFAGREAVEEAIANLPMDWLHMEDLLESFEAFRALDDDAKRRLQA